MERLHAGSEVRRAILAAGLLWLIAAGGGGAPLDAAAGDPIAPQLLEITWHSTPGGAAPILTDGDTLRVDTKWNRTDLSIVADVSAVAPGADPVPLAAVADSVYRLEFSSAEYATDGAGKTIVLEVRAPDLPDSTLFPDLVVCVANEPPEFVSVRTLPSRSVYRGNDLLRVESRWEGDLRPLEVWVDFRGLDPALDAPVAAESTATGFLATHRIPAFAEDRPPDGPVRVPVLCRDAGCGLTVDSSLVVMLDSDAVLPPVLLEWEVRAPLDGTGRPRPLENGDTIRLWTLWDRDGLELAADPFELAPEDTTRPRVVPLGPGEFEIVYTLPRDNARPDGADLPLRLIAEGPSGESTVDSSVRFCLSNESPRHVMTELLRPHPISRGGDTLRVVSRWVSGSRLPLSLEMWVGRLEPGRAGNPVEAEVVASDADSFTFEIAYRIPPLRENRGLDGTGIRLPLIGREIGGCDSLRFDDLLIVDLDTTAPDTTGPVLDPLPAQTTADSIEVSGRTVPQAARVALSRQNVFQTYVAVDGETGRFAGTVALLPDEENALRAWAEDELGNRTRSSDPEFVQQVRTLQIAFEQPFPRGGTIRISDPHGIHGLRLSLFDLEGGLVREWRETSSFLDRIFTWDGADAEGDPVRQGYFILRATWRDARGGSFERTTGLVLGD